MLYDGGPFDALATTTNTDSSVLTYPVVSGPCVVVSGATLNSTGAGTCVIQANGTATANFNSASSAQQSITIQPASAQYETGAGTVNSPAGSYPANPSYAGTSSITSLYARHTLDGTSMIYSANTVKFSYTPASLSFAANYTQFQSLVMSGNRSWLRGTGNVVIAGITTTNVNFLVSVVDSTSSAAVDKVRVKLWKDQTVYYDNQPGAPDTADAATNASGYTVIIFR
ncbi:MAG: hypothetical protein DMF88_14720 [Acidobacteria bacterium]|nr:MAG: hypothetical protein DMF88_14720 [Acidobacteriota bacterium]